MRVIRPAILALVLAFSLAAPGQAQLIGLANPASTFCLATGGELVISDSASGQTGACLFAGGAAIDEWTLYRLFSGPSWFSDF